jgi:hypothetical protein
LNKKLIYFQNAGTTAVLAQLDDWTSRLSETVSENIQNSDMGSKDIVSNTVFLDMLAEDMQKLDSYFAEKMSYLAAYDIKRIQNLILVRTQKETDTGKAKAIRHKYLYYHLQV